MRCAAHRFAAEADFEGFRDRLHVYGADFRDLVGLEMFMTHLLATLPRLDAIVNNACQTIRRPPKYFEHLMHAERAAPPAICAPMLASYRSFRSEVAAIDDGRPSHARANMTIEDLADAECMEPSNTAKLNSDGLANADRSSVGANRSVLPDGVDAVRPFGSGPAVAADSSVLGPSGSTVAGAGAGGLGVGLGAVATSSAELSQLAVLSSDSQHGAESFPSGLRDVNGQQVDTRHENSWTLKMQEVPLPEMVEVMTINSIAPFVINGRLRSLMERTDAQLKFIVNVSAMEGKFYRHKNSTHPHTNMAKAALNMMTRTAAQDYRKVTGLTPATSAPGLGSPLHIGAATASPPPHLHWDWARPCHICSGTGTHVRLACSAHANASHSAAAIFVSVIAARLVFT